MVASKEAEPGGENRGARPRKRTLLPQALLRQLGDEQLVRRVQRGDDRAFEVLFERHLPHLLGFCRHLTGSHDDAEDAVQHAFAAAYRELRSGTGRELTFKPWLYTVARNRCLSLLRERRTTALGEEHADAAQPVTVEQREEIRAILADLRTLPHDQRAALLLVELADMSQSEIARVLGVETARVKALVFRARTTLIKMREARERPCAEVREELATLRGGSLRRSPIALHLRSCPGCREFRERVARQRALLALALPVAVTPALKSSVAAAAGLQQASSAGGAAAGAGGVAAGAGMAGSGAAAGAGGVAAAGGAAAAGTAVTGAGSAGGAAFAAKVVAAALALGVGATGGTAAVKHFATTASKEPGGSGAAVQDGAHGAATADTRAGRAAGPDAARGSAAGGKRRNAERRRMRKGSGRGGERSRARAAQGKRRQHATSDRARRGRDRQRATHSGRARKIARGRQRATAGVRKRAAAPRTRADTRPRPRTAAPSPTPAPRSSSSRPKDRSGAYGKAPAPSSARPQPPVPPAAESGDRQAGNHGDEGGYAGGSSYSKVSKGAPARSD